MHFASLIGTLKVWNETHTRVMSVMTHGPWRSHSCPRALLRLAQGRAEEPSAASFESRTLQSTPTSGPWAG